MDFLMDMLEEEHFLSVPNKLVWAAMRAVWNKSGSVDIVQVKEEMAEHGTLSTAGGQDYLVDLVEAVPSGANTEEWAKLLKRKHSERMLLTTCSEIEKKIASGACDTQEGAEKIHSELMNVTLRVHESDAPVEMHFVMAKLVEQLEEGGSLTKGYQTGFDDLDKLMGGVQKGEVTVVAARTAVGKSMLALNMAENMAEKGIISMFFSVEMTVEQLGVRMLASRSGIDGASIQRGQITETELTEIQKALGAFSQRKIYMDQSSNLSPYSLKRAAHRAMHELGVEVLFVDYLQLMSTSTYFRSQYEKATYLSNTVKTVARDLNVPIVLISQLNRSPESRDDKTPMISDLRDSGAIEQDAGSILLLHRPGLYTDRVDDDHAELILAKHRQGPTGRVKLLWERSRCRFETYNKNGDQADIPEAALPF